ncbi:MAG: M23 family metallopeptidase, partial [Pseudomonadota bacterium]
MNYSPLRRFKGVVLLASPVNNACLSSGFGQRRGRPHRGIDLHHRHGGPVVAAGDGTVLELDHHLGGFGLMVLLDHGRGVFTRYAHLREFARGLSVGHTVRRGDPIGMMGKTGRAEAVHLRPEPQALVVRARVDGVLRPLPVPIAPELAADLLARLGQLAGLPESAQAPVERGT